MTDSLMKLPSFNLDEWIAEQFARMWDSIMGLVDDGSVIAVMVCAVLYMLGAKRASRWAYWVLISFVIRQLVK